MDAVQPTRAPVQLEKLDNEELLQYFCETQEDIYALTLWQRVADRQLNSLARRFCPRGYDAEWMIKGSFSRAYRRFKKHIGAFASKLDTPSFGAYKSDLLKSAVIDERRFVKGQGQKILVQFGQFDVVDDTGALVRTKHDEDADFFEQLEHAREENELECTGDEDVTEPTAELSEKTGEEVERSKGAIAAFLERIEEASAPKVDESRRGGGRKYVSRRTLHLLGVLAQPIPRPDSALSGRERKQIVKLLLLRHLTSEAQANSNDAIVRFFFRDWPKSRIAVLCYGEPPDVTVRNRHEKRVRDTLIHDLHSLRGTLRAEFGITSLRQV